MKIPGTTTVVLQETVDESSPWGGQSQEIWQDSPDTPYLEPTYLWTPR